MLFLTSERLVLYARLARLHRPIGWLLLLWPTLWAVWIAGQGRPAPWIVAVFVSGVVVMRAAGCVINDVFDRHFDSEVSRTKDRPLATAEVSVTEALVLFAVLLLCALGLVLTLNRETVLLATGGVFIAVTYPLFKRFTYLPQVYLGIAFSWGIPMAFAAQTGTVAPVACALLIANLLWTVAYDTMYAMADRPDDTRIGVKSTAILLGRYDRPTNTILQLLALSVLALIGYRLDLNSAFYLGLFGAAATIAYQHWLCRDRDPVLCLKAFINNTWFGASVFAGILLSYATT